IETFGRYGFNKSHSVAYSILSYRTGWFKVYYPAEYMAALLSSEIGNTDRVVQYINEARELDLLVLAPDVNESRYKFTVVAAQRIRFGLGAVRNVGEGAIASIIAGRQSGPYRSLVELCDRIDLRLCNKRVIESLIDAGACDSLGAERSQLVAALDHAFSEAQVRQQEWITGQHALFGDEAPVPRPASPLPDGGYLVTGGYSPRDRGEEQAPFIVEGARALDELRPGGAIGVALRWTAGKAPEPETARAIAALCAAHPGPTPVFLEWSGANGSGNETVRLKSRAFCVDAADDLLAALREILGADGVQLVQVARHPRRPYPLDYVNTVFTDFVELHGDRLYRDDPAMIGGWARLDGTSVMVIGHQKGRDTKENLYRNFGMAHPEGYRKAMR